MALSRWNRISTEPKKRPDEPKALSSKAFAIGRPLRRKVGLRRHVEYVVDGNNNETYVEAGTSQG